MGYVVAVYDEFIRLEHFRPRSGVDAHGHPDGTHAVLYKRINFRAPP